MSRVVRPGEIAAKPARTAPLVPSPVARARPASAGRTRSALKYRADLDAGRFSVLSFCERRIRRIFPALFATLLASVVLGVFLLLPDDLRNLGQSAAAAGMAPWTYAGRVDALSPDGYWRLNETSGATAADSAGSNSGAYQGTPEYIEQTLVAVSGGGGSMGFDAERWLSLTTPITSGAFTLDVALQLDRHKAKHVVATTGGGSVSGQFSIELVDDGASGLQARVWSVSPAGEMVIFRSPAGSVPIGDAFKLSYRRNADGSQSVLINGALQALTIEAGTQPVSWDPPPAGTVYVGRWSNGVDPLDGVMAELAVWNRAVATSDLATLAQAQSLVWLPGAYDAGSVSAGAVKAIDLEDLAHPASGITAATVSPDPSLGSTGLSGAVVIYTAGATPGNNDTFGVRISRGGLTSDTLTVTIDVTAAASALNWNLPYAGQWYGSTEWNRSLGEINLDATSESGTSIFFYAEKSGTVTRFRWQHRVNDNPGEGYSEGDGGTYTVKIVPADAATRLPIPGAVPIAQRTDYRPGNIPGPDWPTVDFTTTGQLVAGQPYCLVFVNTHANPADNYSSLNILNNYMTAATGDPINPPAGGQWDPVVIDGKQWYPLPIAAHNRIMRTRRVGRANIQIGLSDGTWMGPRGVVNSHKNAAGEPEVAITATAHYRDRYKVTLASRLATAVYTRVYRKNNETVNLKIRLESGPASNTSGNGTLIEEITIPSAQIYDVGSGFDREEPGADVVHFVKGAFSTPRLLTLGQIYSVRLIAEGGTLYISGVKGSEHSNPKWSMAPHHMDHDFDTFIARRRLPLGSNIDSMGGQVSTDGGSTWTYDINGYAAHQEFPIIFKCTPA